MAGESDRRTAPSDEYEATAMRAAEPVLHRDKHVARGAALAMIPMALIAAVATVAVAAGADPAAPRVAAVLPFLWFAATVFVLLTRTVVRTVVTTREVQVHWGLWGPRVALEAITACASKRAAGGPVFGGGWQILANHGYVEITWRTPEGAEKHAIFPAHDPDALVAQIDAARAALAPTGVRADAGARDAPEEAAAESAAAGAAARR